MEESPTFQERLIVLYRYCQPLRVEETFQQYNVQQDILELFVTKFESFLHKEES